MRFSGDQTLMTPAVHSGRVDAILREVATESGAAGRQIHPCLRSLQHVAAEGTNRVAGRGDHLSPHLVTSAEHIEFERCTTDTIRSRVHKAVYRLASLAVYLE